MKNKLTSAACLPTWKMSFSLLKSPFSAHTHFYEQTTGMSVFLQIWFFFPCCQWLACLQLFFSNLTVLDQYTFKQCYSTKSGLGKQRESYQNFTVVLLEKVIKFTCSLQFIAKFIQFKGGLKQAQRRMVLALLLQTTS